MEQKAPNPLAKHFRQPKLYLPLPSKGDFWVEGALELPTNKEIPVFPMTAKDEITLRTPDAVLSGQGTVSVIHSCCPNIKDAWGMPSIDLDATLIAIRIASYGEFMDFGTKCPKCGTEHNYDLDLRNIISSIQRPDYETPIQYEGLEILLRPQSYFSANATNQIQFEEQRLLKTLNDDMPEEEKKSKFTSHLNNLVDLNIKTLGDSTKAIISEGNTITDQQFINEFYQNCDTKLIKQIQNRLSEIAQQAAIKPIDVKCDNCTHEFKVELTFDYASFFDNGS